MTVASEHTEEVLAFSVDTEVVEHDAFVNIDARLVVSFLGMHKAHFTLATEGAGKVDALTVLAQVRVVGTLIYVFTVVAVAFVTCIAFALERTIVVDALGVLVTPSVVGLALVDVAATLAVAREAVQATTLVGSRNIDTVGVLMTLMCT